MSDARRLWLPFSVGSCDLAPSNTTIAMSASGTKVSTMFQADKALTITRLGFLHSSKTVGSSYLISLQGADTSGLPDGTVKGGGSPASAAVDTTNAAYGTGTWHWITLANSYACSAGEVLAWVIEYDTNVAATIDGTHLSTIAYNIADLGYGRLRGLPYSVTKVGAGAYAKVTGTQAPSYPIWSYGTSTVAYGFPYKSNSNTAYGSTTEVGASFTLDSAWIASAKLIGIRWFGDTPGAATTNTLSLYSGGSATNPTLLEQSASVDGDLTSNAASAQSWSTMRLQATAVTLTAGTEYTIGLTYSTTAAPSVYYATVDAAADLDAWPQGQPFYYVQRTTSVYPPTSTGNAFTATLTRRPFIELMLDDITGITAGSASILVNPGLTGGMHA